MRLRAAPQAGAADVEATNFDAGARRSSRAIMLMPHGERILSLLPPVILVELPMMAARPPISSLISRLIFSAYHHVEAGFGQLLERDADV